MKTIHFIILFCTGTIFSTIHGQNQSITIPFTEKHWKFAENAVHRFEVFENMETLVLNGKASVKNISMENGSIEVAVYATQKRSFAGIVFRKQGETMEEVYIRNHKSGQPDAVQYAPIYNGEGNWQLYREHQAHVFFEREGWNHLKLVFNQQHVAVWLNDQKILEVDGLKTENNIGEIGLFSLFENRFANFKYQENTTHTIVKERTKPNSGTSLITEWNLSEAYLYAPEQDKNIDFNGLVYKSVPTEPSGLLPISKYLMKPSFGNFEANEEVYAVVATNIMADVKKRVKFSFDYSDKIVVFLNGTIVFEGNNAFLSKGPQFQGHLGITANTIYLDLDAGENTLHCMVIDKANGWGIIGGIEELN
ncbi:family 16 glycoside hydrolase [Arenibacter sp. GZD96]|uniref:family 16 glycoside hydrolase n=1 Tax=Aurantibrevibacter litoralis TaxID=3106030 RepID=UPI002AFFD0F0|nr:family 16 glycoside hydrolase [Arenibacter sp. GZD-96]MEA1785456.1 family 16 glycoside hydrolase [Arenibacter sp. GZD-96]